jgi:predicted acyltransferase
MTINSPHSLLGNRNLALDVLRGITIAFMVIVNTPGNWETLYSPLAHADWHGFTPTDLVFPTFLFVVGNAMSFSFKNLKEMKAKEFYLKVFKRAGLIFLIGWILNAFPFVDYNESGQIEWVNWSEVRLFGVLQRIAVCYLIAALLLKWGGLKLAGILSVLALILYWPVLYYGGDALDPYSLIGNAALKIDLLAIGENRMYGGEGIPFDPEGILSTFPATVNVLAGFFAGVYLQGKHQNSQKVKWLLVSGIVLITVSYLWHLTFPINKKIWTSSYVLLTVGYDLLLLCGLMVVIEIKKRIQWTYFFQVFGRNPLILYVCSGLVISIFSMIPIGDTSFQEFFYSNFFASWLSPKAASFLFALAYTLLIWGIGFWMDKRKIYIKV